jgi:hypothetical protein
MTAAPNIKARGIRAGRVFMDSLSETNSSDSRSLRDGCGETMMANA